MPQPNPQPEMLIVGGPNGAGKSTLALRYAAAMGGQYVGADDIARQLCPEDPFSVRIASGERFIERIDKLIQNSTPFVVETTLAGKTFDQYIRRASSRGYEITIVFIFLDSEDVCVERVRQRVRKGGHDVPDVDVRRRFGRSIVNFWRIYRKLADNWVIAYNSGEHLQDIAIGSRAIIAIRDEALFRNFLHAGGLVEHE